MKLQEFLEKDIISYLDSLQETPEYKINPAGQEEIEQLLQKSQQDETKKEADSSSSSQPVQKEIIREVVHDHTPQHVQDMHVEDSIFPSEEQRRLQKDFSHQDIAQQDIPLHKQAPLPSQQGTSQQTPLQNSTQPVYVQSSASPQISPAQIQEMIQQEVKGLLAASSFAPSQHKPQPPQQPATSIDSRDDQVKKVRQEIEQSLRKEISQLQQSLQQLQQEKQEASKQREHLAQELQRTRTISLQREEELRKQKNEEITKLSQTLKNLEHSEEKLQQEITKLHTQSNTISLDTKKNNEKKFQQKNAAVNATLHHQPLPTQHKNKTPTKNPSSHNNTVSSSLPDNRLQSTVFTQQKPSFTTNFQEKKDEKDIKKREEYTLLLALEKDLNNLKNSLAQKNYDKALLEYQNLKKQAASIRYHSFQKKLLFDQLKNVATVLELADQKRKRAKENKNSNSESKPQVTLAHQSSQPKSSQEIHQGLEQYVKALQAIKEKDKLTALRLLIDLSKKHPRHRGVKLHLQEALQL